MSYAKSTAELMKWKDPAGGSYRAKVVFALRFFELQPHDYRAASNVLDLIPKNAEQDSVWHATGFSLCHAESVEDETRLGKFGVRLPRDLARAVLLVPEKMLDYVAYANTSCQDPESDYAVQMQVVCRSKPQEFLKAVDQLPSSDKTFLLSRIFNPNECRALHFPEAD
jgi:hypothetical protein